MSVNWVAPISTGTASWLTSTGVKMEPELVLDAVFTVAVGMASALFADAIGFVSGENWSTVCPLTGLDTPKVADAASTAAKTGDKCISLMSFGTSTHHVYCELAISFLFVVHCPLSVGSFSDLSIANCESPTASYSSVPRTRSRTC
jgi:hypothetical protein